MSHFEYKFLYQEMPQ